jgi:hypothetical protein
MRRLDFGGNEEKGWTYDNYAIPEISRDVEYLPDDQPQDLKKNVAFKHYCILVSINLDGKL